ncbi:MAG: dTDP-4-dehydrorhamnose 3,5-epimerase [Bacteroidales bacterium]|jgi:dTDP-4-dehydrorhamnose 3,5-epimerase|nr:dTDP-4-dehydrorhamnose 3,5-epimerase [Bacteroidales bacterium]
MKIIDTPFSDLKIVQSEMISDSRGFFQKLFHENTFQSSALQTDFKEFYFSKSHKNVIRGLHFQLPPYEHAKLVFVSHGEILDVVLDIRKKSPTYGKIFTIPLNDSCAQALYIPVGFAHGFLSLKDHTIVNYMQTSAYDKDSDSGILYSSIPFDWNQIESPIVSERDQSLITLQQFNSPF